MILLMNTEFWTSTLKAVWRTSDTEATWKRPTRHQRGRPVSPTSQKTWSRNAVSQCGESEVGSGREGSGGGSLSGSHLLGQLCRCCKPQTRVRLGSQFWREGETLYVCEIDFKLCGKIKTLVWFYVYALNHKTIHYTTLLPFDLQEKGKKEESSLHTSVTPPENVCKMVSASLKMLFQCRWGFDSPINKMKWWNPKQGVALDREVGCDGIVTG